MSNEGFHEPYEELSDKTRDMHRAIISLMEELEAVDWYQQRVDACKDPDLKKSSRITVTRKSNMPPWSLSGSGVTTAPSTRN